MSNSGSGSQQESCSSSSSSSSSSSTTNKKVKPDAEPRREQTISTRKRSKRWPQKSSKSILIQQLHSPSPRGRPFAPADNTVEVPDSHQAASRRRAEPFPADHTCARHVNGINLALEHSRWVSLVKTAVSTLVCFNAFLGCSPWRTAVLLAYTPAIVFSSCHDAPLTGQGGTPPTGNPLRGPQAGAIPRASPVSRAWRSV